MQIGINCEQSIKIDLGCGRYKIPGTIGIDSSPDVNPDILLDFVQEELPFENDSVSVVYCSHVLEHVEDIFTLMNKIHRVLAPNGKLVIEVPYWSSEGAFRDPTHVRFFSEKSFDYWEPHCECAYYANSAPFKIESKEYLINQRIWVKCIKAIFGITALKAFNNMIPSMKFVLVPIK